MNAKKDRKEIGLAGVGTGTIGKIRAVFARDYPGVGWIGVCDKNESLANKVAEETKPAADGRFRDPQPGHVDARSAVVSGVVR